MKKKEVSMALESYLEQIAEIQEKFGTVNSSVLAERMGCKRSSVTNALQKLSEKGLINYQSYRPVTLTDAGLEKIKRLDSYHKILADFFTNVLKLPEEFSQEEACRLEHQASSETIERMGLYNKFLHECSNDTFENYILTYFKS